MKNLLDITILIPVFNEYESLKTLNDEIVSSIPSEYKYEIIYINDGSSDDSINILKDIYKKNNNVRIINFYKNRGKSEALNIGFKKSSGNIVITLDADLQDDPKEIPNLIKEINSGFDMVSGWKKNRKDPFDKTFPSKIFNFVLRRLSGIKIHDFNCGIKAYKKHVVKTINIYGGLHRFIPILVKNNGFSVSEIIVNHRQRKFGFSKYGKSRLFDGAYDLITVLFLKKYLNKPLHLFGKWGIVFSVLGLCINLFLTWQWLLFNFFQEGLKYSINRPLLFFGILLLVVGIQFVSIGLIGELIVFFNKRNKYLTDNNEYINFS
ncbi:MAG: glycosyltransferase [Candidatus Marinimicrobia bacterium]|nr:glycosyltransferase [Candidatus Neomarinimicrobiota bacterium]|tara:strand:+ start:5297 stop:6259 length:963 start_codon:yes stop_codon:yes gene_type:complete